MRLLIEVNPGFYEQVRDLRPVNLFVRLRHYPVQARTRGQDLPVGERHPLIWVALRQLMVVGKRPVILALLLGREESYPSSHQGHRHRL